MSAPPESTTVTDRPYRFASALGALVAVVLFTTLGEAFLRTFPPTDMHRYLGDESPLCGPFAADAELGVRYRDWPALAADYPDMPPLDPAADPRPTWAFFGNSFVQAPGMLAETTRDLVPARRIFHLGRNEYLNVRLAQIAPLLDAGLQPERIVINLMPLDTAPFGCDPLSSVHVNPRGAMTFRPRYPDGISGRLLASSALARAGWFRSGWHHVDSTFHPKHLARCVPDHLLADIEKMFAAIACVTRTRQIPVTVLLTPTYEQVVGRAAPVFQDAVTPLLQRHGLDVCDVRATFAAWPEERKPALFIPDKHFSPPGNVLLLMELLRHWRERGENPPPIVWPGGPT
jgi:hypothetical protein